MVVNFYHFRPRRKKSIIWYGVTKCRDDPKYNQCNYCDAKISNSNTTNSRHHLQIEHPKQWAEIVEKYGDIGDNAPITTSTESSDEEVVNKNKSGGVDGPLSDIPMSVSQEDIDTEAQAREHGGNKGAKFKLCGKRTKAEERNDADITQKNDEKTKDSIQCKKYTTPNFG